MDQHISPDGFRPEPNANMNPTVNQPDEGRIESSTDNQSESRKRKRPDVVPDQNQTDTNLVNPVVSADTNVTISQPVIAPTSATAEQGTVTVTITHRLPRPIRIQRVIRGSGSTDFVDVNIPPRISTQRHRVMTQILDSMSLERESQEMSTYHRSHYMGMSGIAYQHMLSRRHIDDMSYEQTLAVTERIGYVDTGLTEDIILKHMKQRKHVAVSEQNPSEIETCCVCQEVYAEGEEEGHLDCGHKFHTGCIKQWLMLKNLCPICRNVGLDTEKKKMGPPKSKK